MSTQDSDLIEHFRARLKKAAWEIYVRQGITVTEAFKLASDWMEQSGDVSRTHAIAICEAGKLDGTESVP